MRLVHERGSYHQQPGEDNTSACYPYSMACFDDSYSASILLLFDLMYCRGHWSYPSGMMLWFQYARVYEGSHHPRLCTLQTQKAPLLPHITLCPSLGDAETRPHSIAGKGLIGLTTPPFRDALDPFLVSRHHKCYV
jgi:hypothetical protein